MPRRLNLDTCWTCRLRRKKCDGARPSCRNCTDLNIECHFDALRPVWMADWARKRDMARQISDQIKEGMVRRRARRGGRGGGQAGGQCGDRLRMVPFIPVTVGMTPPLDSVSGSQDDGHSSAEEKDGLASSLSVVVTTPSNQDASAISLDTPPPSSLSSGPEQAEEGGWQDVPKEHIMMSYLDYCFPFVFPFYRPPMLGTGRGWLLHLLQSNTIACNCATSLSSYFLASVTNEVLPGQYMRCKTRIWARVMKTADKCYEAIQLELLELKNDGKDGVSERAGVMGSILQLMVFDLFVGRSEGWEMHLRPAVSLLDDMFNEHLDRSQTSYQSGHHVHDDTGSQRGLGTLLDHLDLPVRVHGEERSVVWSNEQAAFRFFTALLLYMDVVAATALGRAPMLGKWHDRVLREDQMNDLSPFLDMSLFVGCENWCLVAVAETASLDAWKKEARRHGALSVPDMVGRAAKIVHRLDQGRKALDAKRAASASAETIHARRLRPFSLPVSRSADSDAKARVSTDVWEHAARIYLAVVVSGWQPLNPEVRKSVQEILGLLSVLEDKNFQGGAAQLRALAWPVCVAGCLAGSKPVADAFRDVIHEVMGEMARLGSMHEALQVMESVWRDRDTLEASRAEWDIRTCLSCLGWPVLLV